MKTRRLAWTLLLPWGMALGCGDGDTVGAEAPDGSGETTGEDGNGGDDDGGVDFGAPPGGGATVEGTDLPPRMTSMVRDCGLAGDELGAGIDPGKCKSISYDTKNFDGDTVEAEACVLAHPDCVSGSASCATYVTLELGDAYFDRVAHPEKYGKIVVARLDTDLFTSFRKNESRRKLLARLPDEVAKAAPGLDPDRVYGIGFSSHGAHTLGAQLKPLDDGSLIEKYAATAYAGACPSTGEGEAMPGQHVLTVSGRRDPEMGFEGTCGKPDGSKDAPKMLADKMGCTEVEAEFTPVAEEDALLTGGDGTPVVDKRTFGDCEQADIVHYRFASEGHTNTYGEHFAPEHRFIDIAWNFFQGRTRPGGGSGDGYRGTGSACFPE